MPTNNVSFHLFSFYYSKLIAKDRRNTQSIKFIQCQRILDSKDKRFSLYLIALIIRISNLSSILGFHVTSSFSKIKNYQSF